VTRAGYYAWRRRQASAHAVQDRTLLVQIRTIFTQHHGRYGSPRIHDALQTRGIAVSRRRVARLMREDGLRARAVLGYRAKAGVRRFFDAHPNLVRRTTTVAIDRVWVGDITYLKVGTAWRYLAVVMDRCSRRILAWTLQRRRDGRVTRGVLAAALRRRQPAEGLIFHSDRGSEYLTETLRTFLAARRVRQSACTSGPGDNAHMESFFHSMKAEATRGRHFTTDAELRTVLRAYIRYYNTTRAHSALSYRSPVDFERRAA
jgi:putative transposase